jgi:acetyltransferase-like isoleucine patch superfamily enzyme
MSIRFAVKTAVFWLATIAVSPALASYWIRARMFGRDRALEGSTQSLSMIPGILGQYARRAFLSRVLASFHPTATIEFGTIFSRAGARIGEHAYIGPRCYIGLVHIERDVLVAGGVHIPSGPETHGIDDVTKPIREQEGRQRIVRIGAGSWIGSAAIVMADVGRDTVVGAGSVVTRSLPDRALAAGVPAKVFRFRDGNDRRSA